MGFFDVGCKFFFVLYSYGGGVVMGVIELYLEKFVGLVFIDMMMMWLDVMKEYMGEWMECC